MSTTTVEIQKIQRSLGRHIAVHRARSRISVLRGPSAGMEVVLDSALCRVGSEPGQELTLADPDVSPHHLDILLAERGFALTDLGSRSGTYIGGIRVERANLRPGVVVELGSSTFRFDLTGDAVVVALYDGERLGPLLGRSMVMREALAQLVQLAGDSTFGLICGEPGVECARATQAVHSASDRPHGPLHRLLCSSGAADLDEQLFGSERAGHTTLGLLDTCARGTLVLVDVEAFPLTLQPALLRLIEHGLFHRVGCTRELTSTARLLATSTSSLQAAVQTARMRQDLATRLATVRVALPPLRHRMEDLRMLAGGILADEAPDAAPLSPALLKVLASHSWPGNFDELRTTLLNLSQLGSGRGTRRATQDRAATKNMRAPAPAEVPLAEAKRRWSLAAEEAYLAGLIVSTGHDLDACARIAGVSRRTLQRLLGRHGLG